MMQRNVSFGKSKELLSEYMMRNRMFCLLTCHIQLVVYDVKDDKLKSFCPNECLCLVNNSRRHGLGLFSK